MRHGRLLLAIVTIVLPACGGPPAEPSDAGRMDAGWDAGADAGSADAGGPDDAGADAGAPDAAVIPDAGPWPACDTCLDGACATERGACGDECLAVEACLRTVCSNLAGAADEGLCQVQCQQAHLSGRMPHLAVVNCAQGSTCPECGPAPEPYLACRAQVDAGSCADELDACTASAECPIYRGCVATCTTLAECRACDGTPSGSAGRALAEAYERCVATECVLAAWVP